MAKELKLEIVVDDKGTATIKSFSDDATTQLKKVEDAGGSLGSGFANTWAGIATGANQAIQLFHEIANAVNAPIQAYMESETAVLKMGMAMKNQGDFSREALADMEAFAASIQQTTKFEDDSTLSVMANLKSFGLSNEQVKLATQAALDLATAKQSEGMTVEKASEILGKSYLGIQTGLKKLGIQVDETQSKSELFNSVMMQIEDRFGGSAQATLITYAGQWSQLKNTWQDIQEFMGLVFLKTVEGVMIGVNMLGTMFYTAATSALDAVIALVGGLESFAKWAGFDGVANGIGVVNSGLISARDNTQAATDAAMANVVQYTENIATFDNVANAIDNMGKAGKKTTASFDEDAKSQKDILKSLETANKEHYDALIAEADRWKATQIDNGANVLAVETEYYSKKSEALWAWYDSNWNAIEEMTIKESEKNAKLLALNAEYNKALEKGQTDQLKGQIDYNDKRITTEADLYKTINQYSDDSVAAEITALEKKYQAAGNYTANRTLLLQALYKAEWDIIEKKNADIAQAELTTWSTVDQYSSQAVSARIVLWQQEAEKYIEKTGDKEGAAIAFAAKVRDLEIQQTQASAEFYGNVQGFAQTAYMFRADQIDLETKKLEQQGYDEEAIIQYRKQRYADAYLEMAQKGDDFWDGWNAQLEDAKNHQTTWGQAGVETMKAMSTEMSKQFGTLFEDVYQGKLKNLGDYAGAIWDSTRKKFFDMAGQIAADEIKACFSMSWVGDSWKSVVGVLGKILGWAGDWLDDLDLGQYFGVSFADGGRIPGYSPYPGNDKRNDRVPILASGGEYMEPRTAVNDETLPMLEYIRETGKLPRGYADGGLVVTEYTGHRVTLSDGRYYDMPFIPDIYDLNETSPKAGLDFTGLQMALEEYEMAYPQFDWTKELILAAKTNRYDVTGKPLPADVYFALQTYILQQNATKTGYGGMMGMIDAAIKWLPFGEQVQDSLYYSGPMGLASVIAGAAGASQDQLDELKQNTHNLAAIVGMSYLAGSAAGDLASAGAGAADTGMSSIVAAGGAEHLIYTSADLATMSGTGSMFGALTNVSSELYWQTLAEQTYQSAIKYLMNYPVNQMKNSLLNKAVGSITGGSLDYDISTDGFSGGAALKMLPTLNGIIGSSGTIPSAKNGWDYIPRDNTLVNTHEGEKILTKQEAREYRAGNGSKTLHVTFNLMGTVIDRQALNEFAEQLYPRLKQLEVWGH